MPGRQLHAHERQLAEELRTAVARLGDYDYIDRDEAIEIVAAARSLPPELVERLLAGRLTTSARRTS